jgi:hypothetical protein
VSSGKTIRERDMEFPLPGCAASVLTAPKQVVTTISGDGLRRNVGTLGAKLRAVKFGIE